MKKLLIATKNPGKMGEFKEFLSDLSFEIVSLKDLNITEEVNENGMTYEENSQKKALFYANLSGLPTVADDGGIEIAALNNEPGVRSRRWLGHESTDEELMNHMIKISKELPENNRIAYFRTVVSLAQPNGEVCSVTGEVKGVIAKEPHWKALKGYPYRSFFYLPEIGKYYHESDLTPDEQKLYNHRYKAVQKLIPIVKRVLSIKK